ncbi:MAG: Wax ester synthase/acyl-CoA:diacylglycerol acyltransferase [Burkholderiaceae bacterium]|jgi:WS/DGAT/MGAT family acyltransferase|nr:MAG: Wax ester synthase/acyl-CoA:diacylglycerol acyltransferase [Burkholderiaceae bacterium]
MDHLSIMDASFLHLETPETPMHVGSLMLFELPKGYRGDYYEDVKKVIGERMHLVTLFHRKLAQMPFELADPVWIEDDDIDLDYHVRHVSLRKPGTMEQLEQLVARLHSTLLDRSRPLWEVVVIDGLANGQIGYYTKAHHSGIDGKAGVELSKVLYDTTPEIRKVPPPHRMRRAGQYQLGVAELLQAAVSNSVAQYAKLGRLLPTAAKALDAAGRLLAAQGAGGAQRSANLGLSAKTIFNVAITNQRSYSTMSLSLDELKALGKRVGGTVNTIVMAMCSGALRRFLSARGELPHKAMLAAVPVSLRSAGDSQMNNQVSVIRVDLATDIADPRERFKAIHASSEAAKAVVSELKPVLGADMPVLGSPWLMTGLASLYARSSLPSRVPPLASVLISNVPGLPMTMYLAGAKMLHFYPVSIPYHGNAMNITVQSYTGLLEFGITACRRALSQDESHELLGHMRAALEEIRGFDSVAEAVPAAAEAAPASTRPARRRAASGAPAVQRRAKPASAKASSVAAKTAAQPTRRRQAARRARATP